MSEKRWKTNSGVVVIEHGRTKVRDRRGQFIYKVYAYRETGGFHGLLWIKNLRPAES